MTTNTATKASGSKAKSTKKASGSNPKKSAAVAAKKAKAAAAKKSKAKKSAAKKAAAPKAWNDKPKNKLVAFWEDEKYLIKLDRAIKKDGKHNSRSAFLKECCNKLIEKYA